MCNIKYIFVIILLPSLLIRLLFFSFFFLFLCGISFLQNTFSLCSSSTNNKNKSEEQEKEWKMQKSKHIEDVNKMELLCLPPISAWDTPRVCSTDKPNSFDLLHLENRMKLNFFPFPISGSDHPNKTYLNDSVCHILWFYCLEYLI